MLVKKLNYGLIGCITLVLSFTTLAVTADNTANHKTSHSAEVKAVESANVTAQGKIIAINLKNHELTIHHRAIPELSWPEMTMSFLVANKLNISQLKAGDVVHFTLQKNQNGDMMIVAVTKINQD